MKHFLRNARDTRLLVLLVLCVVKVMRFVPLLTGCSFIILILEHTFIYLYTYVCAMYTSTDFFINKQVANPVRAWKSFKLTLDKAVNHLNRIQFKQNKEFFDNSTR